MMAVFVGFCEARITVNEEISPEMVKILFEDTEKEISIDASLVGLVNLDRVVSD